MTTFAWASDRRPTWLDDFKRDPLESLDSLLRNRYYHDSLNAHDPDQLLIEWSHEIDDPDFREQLDNSLLEWIKMHWSADDRELSNPAVTWHRVMRIVATIEPVPESTLKYLRAVMLEAVDRLGPMVSSQAQERSWVVLGRPIRNQPDRSLGPLWLKLCRLDPEVPVFHGRWGVLGLRRAPGEDLGRFRISVAVGLEVLLRALVASERDGRIRLRDAERLAKTEMVLASKAYPFPKPWLDFWTSTETLPSPADKWVASVFSTRSSNRSRTSVSPQARRIRPNRDWAARSQQISAALKANDASAVGQAEKLTNEQRPYFEQSGDYGYLVRTLTSVANSARSAHPDIAYNWAAEAHSLTPWDHFTWTCLLQCAWAIGRYEEAIELGYGAVERFPSPHVPSRHSLA